MEERKEKLREHGELIAGYWKFSKMERVVLLSLLNYTDVNVLFILSVPLLL
jgi:hypothetical protein